ncbi:tautomerase family protein [Neptuniibacter halophilus]|uniref:tautomerase family protein n=1 Tax=Neptuniibacter halophilus TaxID=651666 RepID=UPI00257418EC|nr:hypothetical protein [Neptuniibacter halophilus]
MPYISVQLSADISADQKSRLSRGITHIMGEILGKETKLTAVHITTQGSSHWSINAEQITASSGMSAFIDARISAGSNTEEEKRNAIAALHRLLETTLGHINPISYAALTEIPATDWGYDGKTQYERKLKRTASGAVDTDHYLHKGRRLRSEILPRFGQLFR